MCLVGAFIGLCGTATGEVSVSPTPVASVSREINAPATPAGSVLPSATAPSVIRGDDSLLQFESMLLSEAKGYREYLEKTLDNLKWAIGIFGGLALVAFTWLNYKTGKDVRAQVNARFRTSIDDLVNKRVEELDTLVQSNRKRVEEISVETNQLMGRIANFVAVWTNAFVLLDLRSKDEQYELARRDAMRQLEAVRRDFPHWRHLGIVLGRLHKHFGDYKGAVDALTDVIDERDRRHLPHGIDYAALLYSRACYQNRLAETCERENEEEAERLRAAAWHDLRASVGDDPENAAEANVDQDLTSLWDNTNRKKGSLKT